MNAERRFFLALELAGPRIVWAETSATHAMARAARMVP
jgi:hypothetical protein